MPSERGIKWLLHLKFAPISNNANALFCSNFHNSYPTVFKKHYLSTFHVLFISGCGFGSWHVCIKNTGSANLEHFDPIAWNSLWKTVLSIIYWPAGKMAGGTQREWERQSVQQATEAHWLTRAGDTICAEPSKTRRASNVPATLGSPILVPFCPFLSSRPQRTHCSKLLVFGANI
jgi:hypothetical protein